MRKYSDSARELRGGIALKLQYSSRSSEIQYYISDSNSLNGYCEFTNLPLRGVSILTRVPFDTLWGGFSGSVSNGTRVKTNTGSPVHVSGQTRVKTDTPQGSRGR